MAEQVTDEVERQLYDEDRIRAELLQLELEFDDGLIDDEERTIREDELLERMAVAQARRQFSETNGWEDTRSQTDED